MKLPDGNGLTLIEYMQNDYPDVPVAMITAHGSVESAIEALKLGAFDFVTKPPPAAVLLKKAANIASGSGEPNKEKVGKMRIR